MKSVKQNVNIFYKYKILDSLELSKFHFLWINGKIKVILRMTKDLLMVVIYLLYLFFSNIFLFSHPVIYCLNSFTDTWLKTLWEKKIGM